jgi:hypothetical protein
MPHSNDYEENQKYHNQKDEYIQDEVTKVILIAILTPIILIASYFFLR